MDFRQAVSGNALKRRGKAQFFGTFLETAFPRSFVSIRVHPWFQPGRKGMLWNSHQAGGDCPIALGRTLNHSQETECSYIGR